MARVAAASATGDAVSPSSRARATSLRPALTCNVLFKSEVLALKRRKDQNINGLMLRRFPRVFFANKDLR